VKILLKEQLAEDLISGNKKLKEIKIGVVKETTTLKMLEQEKDVNKIGYDRWDQALNALDQNQVDAFASDTLIVLTLLNRGVNEEIKTGVNEQEKLLVYRDEYKNKNGGYTIYPKSSYLIPSAKKNSMLWQLMKQCHLRPHYLT
jgi:ABC-type amino acid transport substrate-binding protein